MPDECEGGRRRTDNLRISADARMVSQQELISQVVIASDHDLVVASPHRVVIMGKYELHRTIGEGSFGKYVGPGAKALSVSLTTLLPCI